MTKQERAKILALAAEEQIKNDPFQNRFVLANLLIAASQRFLPVK